MPNYSQFRLKNIYRRWLDIDNITIYKSRLTYEAIEPVLRSLSMVRYSIIKGETISVSAYNAVDKLISSDVDILVSRKNLRIFEIQLLKHGFEKQQSDNSTEQRINRGLMLSGSHQTSPFYKKTSAFKLCIDLNFDIFWGEYTGKRVDEINMQILDTFCDIETVYQVSTGKNSTLLIKTVVRNS